MAISNRAKSTGLLAAASVIAMTGAAMGQDSQKQNSDVSALSAARDAIVVTGTKKAGGEQLQGAPVAATVVTEELLDLTKVNDIQGLSYSMPNVHFGNNGTAKGVAAFAIRGYGVGSSVQSIEPAVGTFVDGIFLGSNYGVITDFFDVQSVEVLRGPQGLLFGRNVTAGAVLINSARPEFDDFIELSAELETGLEETYTAVGNAALSDAVAVRIGGYYNKDDGYFKNPLTGTKRGGGQTFLIRPSITTNFTDNFSHTLLYEHGEITGQGAASQGRNLFSGHDVGNEPGLTDIKWDRVMSEATVDVSFGDGTITNLFGWRKVKAEQIFDVDGTPSPDFYTFISLDQKQFSNELRYNGRFGAFDVTLGGYYFAQNMSAETANYVFASPGPSGGKLDHDAWGAFATLDYSITDKLTLTAGGRYTEETKDAAVAPRDSGYCVINSPELLAYVDIECSNYFNDEKKWSNWIPKFGAKFQATDELMFYAHYTKGFRSGAFNLRQATSIKDIMGNPIAGAPPVDEETHPSYEVGAKADFNDGRTILNVALFHDKILGQQQTISVFVTAPGNPIPQGVQTEANVAKVRIRGAEVELYQQIGSSLNFDGSLGFIDAEYISISQEGLDAGITPDLEVTRSPKFSATANLTYDLNLGANGNLISRVGYAHRSSWYSEVDNATRISPVDIFNAYLTYYPPNGNWSVSLYGKNLSNEVVVFKEQPLPSIFPGGSIRAFEEGRVFGGKVKVRF